MSATFPVRREFRPMSLADELSHAASKAPSTNQLTRAELGQRAYTKFISEPVRLWCLQQEGPFTSHDLADDLNLNLNRASSALSYLFRKGALLADGKGYGMGRPTNLYVLNPDYVHKEQPPALTENQKIEMRRIYRGWQSSGIKKKGVPTLARMFKCSYSVARRVVQE